MREDLELIYQDCVSFNFDESTTKIVIKRNGYTEKEIDQFLKEKKDNFEPKKIVW